MHITVLITRITTDRQRRRPTGARCMKVLRLLALLLGGEKKYKTLTREAQTRSQDVLGRRRMLTYTDVCCDVR
jgi:hypothetical protein